MFDFLILLLELGKTFTVHTIPYYPNAAAAVVILTTRGLNDRTSAPLSIDHETQPLYLSQNGYPTAECIVPRQ